MSRDEYVHHLETEIEKLQEAEKKHFQQREVLGAYIEKINELVLYMNSDIENLVRLTEENDKLKIERFKFLYPSPTKFATRRLYLRRMDIKDAWELTLAEKLAPHDDSFDAAGHCFSVADLGRLAGCAAFAVESIMVQMAAALESLQEMMDKKS